MMDSEDRPFSKHYYEQRECEFCSELFYAHHGHQRYCPEKFGKKDYCKYKQKSMLTETRLADRVVELANTGMSVRQETPLEKNKQVLLSIMGTERQKIVSCAFLDYHGFDIKYYDSRIPINGATNFLTHIGNFSLELIKQEGTILTFKITRKWT